MEENKKQIFAYTDRAELRDEDRLQLEAAGYICIRVKSMESIKVIDLLPSSLMQDISDLALSKIQSISAQSPFMGEFGIAVARLTSKWREETKN